MILNSSLCYLSFRGSGMPERPSQLGGSGLGSLPVLHSGCCGDTCLVCEHALPRGLARPGSRPSQITLCPQHVAKSEHGAISHALDDQGPRAAHFCLIVTIHWKPGVRDFPGVPGLRLHTPSAEGLGSILGQGTRSHVPQLRVCLLQLELACSAAKT